MLGNEACAFVGQVQDSKRVAGTFSKLRWEGRLHQFVDEAEALTPHAVTWAWLEAYACPSTRRPHQMCSFSVIEALFNETCF
ncbi:hypothetical protein EAH_00066870 [Eimeria acervulina]|uniref:Uncharacterized protein n=1 Tax=Eimeria acervulina TaxID=5801 RepID=U6GTE9_EIMAC|nr:hypothetical protein EAH_00066870 [Eimeria acervulina]CDI82538.1 hypothetical protein EAH_00066870 [Eimeria acervulina]